MERQPIDAGLLTCRAEPLAGEVSSDLDLLALVYAFREAWSDCSNKLARIRAQQAQPVAPVVQGR